MSIYIKQNNKGFTLIELLVVIAIIGLLSSVVLASLVGARARANDARRASDLVQVRNALELFASANNGSYPTSGGNWRSQCTYGGSLASADAVVPGVAPTFIARVPVDTETNVAAGTCCYGYLSDGNNYKFILHSCPTLNYASRTTLLDPSRDGGSNATIVDAPGTGAWAWAVYTSGASGF